MRNSGSGQCKKISRSRRARRWKAGATDRAGFADGALARGDVWETSKEINARAACSNRNEIGPWRCPRFAAREGEFRIVSRGDRFSQRTFTGPGNDRGARDPCIEIDVSRRGPGGNLANGGERTDRSRIALWSIRQSDRTA